VSAANAVLVFGFAICLAILGDLALEIMDEPDPEVFQARADLERSKREFDEVRDRLTALERAIPNCAAGGAHATTADP
jgi:hypothetical protein